MGVSKNRGTPKSSILIGFSIINHPFWGAPIFGNTHIYIWKQVLAICQAGKNWILDILADLVTRQVLNMPIAQVRRKLQGLQTRHQSSWEMLQKHAETTIRIRIYVWNSQIDQKN